MMDMLGYFIRMVSTMAVGALILTGVWYMTDFAWQNIMFVGGSIMALICIGGGNGAMMAGSAVHSMSTVDDIKTQKRDYPAALNPYFVGMVLLTLSVIPLDMYFR
ncbi:hypothetical protein ACFO4L_01100 [Bacillus daqingensis]|uniref:Uncharacterized protein n=1 Tax=Bacillus daqingensis TaxID=872396 RepID=A0ABV9NPC1_9BACI